MSNNNAPTPVGLATSQQVLEIVAKQIVSVDSIWGEVIRLSDKLPVRLDIFTESEYLTGSADEQLRQILLSDDEMLNLFNDSIQIARPYISDILWNSFFIARAFIGRIHFLIRSDLSKPDGRLFWKNDQGIRQLLKTLWQDDEEKYIAWNKLSDPKLLLTWRYIENIILTECRKVLDINSEELVLPEEVIQNLTKNEIGFKPN